jgi:hypothetical protein
MTRRRKSWGPLYVLDHKFQRINGCKEREVAALRRARKAAAQVIGGLAPTIVLCAGVRSCTTVRLCDVEVARARRAT